MYGGSKIRGIYGLSAIRLIRVPIYPTQNGESPGGEHVAKHSYSEQQEHQSQYQP